MKKSNRTWSVRPATENDQDAIADLFKAEYGNSYSQKHQKWKFWENPEGSPVIVVAVDTKQVVGHYALLPVRLKLGNQRVIGAQSCDTLIHPQYRGQGMFISLAETCIELAGLKGVEALYGFPNDNSFPGFVNRLNWDHTGDTPYYVRFIKPSKHPRMPSLLGIVSDAASILLPSGNKHGIEIEISNTVPSDDILNDMIEVRKRVLTGCMISRSIKWMHWRFSGNSQNKYEWIIAKKDGKPLGCAVWGILHNNNGVLAELIGEEVVVLKALVATVIKRAFFYSVPILSAVTTMPGIKKILYRAGFIRYKQIPMITREISNKILSCDIRDYASWKITGADIDTF